VIDDVEAGRWEAQFKLFAGLGEQVGGVPS